MHRLRCMYQITLQGRQRTWALQTMMASPNEYVERERVRCLMRVPGVSGSEG